MQNFFTVFELEEKYNLDLSLLDFKYFALLAKYHPDKALLEKDKYEYITYSTIINSGYKILKDDFERAAHILELHGINIKDDSKAPTLPFDILEEILDRHEEFELANETKRQELLTAQLDKKQTIISNLHVLFNAGDYKAAAIEAMQLKYYKG